MTTLKIMCGIAGSGKSTYVRQHASREDLIVSRDEIRFSLIDSDKSIYFSQEKKVFKEFCKRINEGIKNQGEVIWIDATHLNKQSRQKLLNNINYKTCVIEMYAINTSLEQCLNNNAKREGIRKVPENVIKTMHERFTIPNESEFSNIKYSIYEI